MKVQEYQLFAPMVRRIARKARINSLVDADDLEQELWVKILKVLPAIRTLEEKPSEQMSSLRTILSNYVIDIGRHYTRRPDTSIQALCDTFEDIVELAFADFSVCFSQPPTDGLEVACGKELEDVLVSYASNKCKKFQRFIKETIQPSQQILAAWEARIAAHPQKAVQAKYRKSPTIPPLSLCSLVGLSTKEFQQHIRDLGAYLKRLGYDLSFTRANC